MDFYSEALLMSFYFQRDLLEEGASARNADEVVFLAALRNLDEQGKLADPNHIREMADHLRSFPSDRLGIIQLGDALKRFATEEAFGREISYLYLNFKAPYDRVRASEKFRQLADLVEGH